MSGFKTVTRAIIDHATLKNSVIVILCMYIYITWKVAFFAFFDNAEYPADCIKYLYFHYLLLETMIQRMHFYIVSVRGLMKALIMWLHVPSLLLFKADKTVMDELILLSSLTIWRRLLKSHPSISLLSDSDISSLIFQIGYCWDKGYFHVQVCYKHLCIYAFQAMHI